MAISATVSPGKIFSDNESVTIAKLNALGTPTVDISGAVGSLSISDNSITDAKIQSGAAIQYSKLASLATGQLVVGNAGTPTATTISGHATIDAAGAVTVSSVSDNAITPAKMEDGTQGDILIYGASGAPERLGFGTSGQFLKTQGTGANAVWADVPTAIPAFEQVTLTGTNMVYNNSSHGTSPVEGSFGDDEAFWLVQDDNSDSMDLSLTIASTSKVKLTVDLETDTDHHQVCTSVRVQRSTDSGATWTDMPRGDAASTRVQVAFTTQHGYDARNTGRSSWHYIDSPSSTSVRYRVIYGLQSGHKIYLNREASYDSDGDAGSVSDAEYRTTSYFLAEEILQ